VVHGLRARLRALRPHPGVVAMTIPPLLRLLFVLAVALLLSSACAGTGPILYDAQRCARFGGIWQGDTCKSAA